MEFDILKKCMLCPRNCGVDRYKTFGVCGADYRLKIAHYSVHMWEEPIISGRNGSGTIFFSNCNLKCIFCQNKKISTDGYGKYVSDERFKNMCLELQGLGASNINLVTPTHYVPQIVNVLQNIKGNELKIPIVYNTSSYENVDTIKLLNNIVDIYLADLKYFDDDLGEKFSNCKNYFKYATRAIWEMYEQVGDIIIGEDGLLKKGLVVRVLVLPGHIDDSKKIIKYLYDKYKNKIFISIMNQYTPINKCLKYKELNRCVTDNEYNDVINYACDIGVYNAFIQEGGTQLDSFIPDFDCSNI